MTRANLDARQSQAALEEILAPDGSAWNEITGEVIELRPTPLDRQPSAYVQVAWQDRNHGEVSAITVQAIRKDDSLILRLQWDASQPKRSINDINAYADACAILFPADGKNADLETMGSPELPVIAWHWRAGTDLPFVVTARGIGTVERAAEHQVQASSRWSDGKWQVVLAGPLNSGEPSLAGGTDIPIAFAVWCGAATERAGLKAHSPEFHLLRIA
jgi:DMSO reductase family type II enzyme heme b subunit